MCRACNISRAGIPIWCLALILLYRYLSLQDVRSIRLGSSWAVEGWNVFFMGWTVSVEDLGWKRRYEKPERGASPL